MVINAIVPLFIVQQNVGLWAETPVVYNAFSISNPARFSRALTNA